MILGKAHIYSCEVTYDLVDADGVLHHPNYLILFERARIKALAEGGYPYAQFWKEGFGLVLRENHSEYFRSVGMDQALRIATTTVSGKGARIELLQRMYLKNIDSTLPDGYQDENLTLNHPDLGSDLLIHQVKMKLVCITPNPIRAVRFPEKFASAFGLS